MTVANAFSLYGVLLPNGSWINELQDLTPAANIAHFVGRSASGVVPDFRGGFGAAPDVSFTTPQIKTVIDACGLVGYDMSGGNCDLYYRANTNLGGPGSIAASVHLRLRCVKALLYWTGITARQNQPAAIACRIVPTYDGTNPPFVALSDQAIPSGAGATEFFTLGPIKLGAVSIGALASWSLALNPTMRTVASDGEAYLSWCGVESHDPVITAETNEIESWSTLAIDGAPLAGLAAYLRRLKPDEPGTYADGDAYHIKFTGANGLITPEQSAGGITAAASLTLRIGLRRTNASDSHVMSVSTASAIT